MRKNLLLLISCISLLANAQTGTYTIIDTTMGLPSNEISCLKVISANEYWVGTFNKGAAKFLNGNWQYFNTHNTLLPDSTIHDIEVDKTGKVWISTLGGIGIYNGSTWQKIDSTNSPMHTSPFYNCNLIYTNFLECDSSGNMWIASGDRLIKSSGAGYTVFNTPPQSTSGGTLAVVCTGTLDPITSFDIDKKSNTFLVMSYMQGVLLFDGTNFTVGNGGGYYNGKYIYTTLGCADSLTHWYKASDVDSANFNNNSSRTEGTWVINTDPGFTAFYTYDSIATGLVKNPNNQYTYGRIKVSTYNKFVWATNTNNVSHYDRTDWIADTSLHINGNVSAIDFDNTGNIYFGCVGASYNVVWLKQSQLLSKKGLIIYKPKRSVGIESLSILNFNMGPSPTTGVISISNPNVNSYEIEISNIAGQIIATQKIEPGKNSININSEPNGVFFYTIKDKNQIAKRGKIIKVD